MYVVIFATLVIACLGQEVPGFLPPVVGLYAEGADLFPTRSNLTLEACAAWCTSTPGCISLNYCSESECGIQTWSPSYNPGASPVCNWYRRVLPRNDTPISQAVPWVLAVPAPGTVSLKGGPMYGAFEGNINDYIKLRDPLDMLYWYASRSGVPNPQGKCYGWGGWIKGSETGNYLMGAGSTLQWRDDLELKAGVASVIAGIREYQDKTTGWLMAFNESDLFTAQDNYPDYEMGWVVRGLLDSYRAGGLPDALQLARDTLSNFNNHTSLPWFLPQNGGASPVLPYPPQFDNKTFGGYGQPAGHTIYIEYQGMIKSTLMALSPLGTQSDVDIVQDLYAEQWWLEALLAKDLYHGIWHRQFFAHNYEVTAFEAFLDMYVLTGNATYLTAVSNAWEMLRDHWILPGGSFALNEGNYYPPDSYYIGFIGTPSPAFRGGGHAHHPHSHDTTGVVNTSDPYFHSPCIFRDDETAGGAGDGGGIISSHAASTTPTTTTPSSDPPTGELCGSVFWTLLNQRFHRLYPNNETFVGEMERSILNVGVAALGQVGSGGEGPGGRGIRYFANQHKVKQTPTMRSTCCESQGTRLFGSLPSFLFTLEESPTSTTVRVDLYAQSSLTSIPLPPTVGGGVQASLSVDTQWPYGTSVTINLTLASGPLSPAGSLNLGFRMPSWLPGPVSVSVAGVGEVGVGQPGTYFFPPTPPTTSTLYTFTLPMAFSPAPYTGSTQIPPFKRYSYLLGPVLMAMQGPWDTPSDSLVMPAGAALDPLNPAEWLVPSGDGNALHFNVTGAPGYSMKPYWEVQEPMAW